MGRDTKQDEKLFGFSRNVFFLGLVSFFNDFSAEMVQSVMPAFLTSVLGASAFLVGLIEGAADALASVLKLFSGWFSDKIGRRKLPAALGYALSVGIRPFLSLVFNFWQVFGLRMVDRVGKGFRDAPRDALIAESVLKSELGKSYGLHRSLDTLGATLGPLLAFLILPFLGGDYRKLFLVAFVIGLGALFSFFFVSERKRAALGARSDSETRRDPRSKDERDISISPRPIPKLDLNLLRQNKKFALVVASIFVFGLGTLPIILLLLKAKEVGLPGVDLPLVYFIYSLTFVLSAVPLGRLADAIGERLVIAGGFLFATVAYFGLSRAQSPAFTIILFVILGLYSAATDGLQRSLAAKRLDPEILATGQGFLNMAIGFSSLFAGVIGGLLWTRWGSSSALIYAGGFSLLGLILFLSMTGTRLEDNA